MKHDLRPQLIDAHAHLDHYADEEVPQLLEELARERVLTFAVAMDPPSYARTCALAKASPWIVSTFGVHPWRAQAYADRLDELDPLIAASPMLGEIGLDTVWVDDPIASYPAQRAVLAHFLQAAHAQQKIVNLHTKGAEAEILAMLAHYTVERAIIHWYSGPLDVADALVARGCWFTIGVEVHSSPVIQEIARRLPSEQLLIETDNPGGIEWLTGERGFPRHLSPVVATLAQLRGDDPEELREILLANTARLIGDDLRLRDVRERLI